MNKICLYGHTENENYGGCLTYYALGKAIEKLGYDLTVIPRSSDVTKEVCSLNPYYPESPSVKFFSDNFKMAERLPFERFVEYNKLAETFVLGSDMIWKDGQYLWAKDTFYLNFVNENKRKIAYATSFGTNNPDEIYFPKGRIETALNYIRKFDKISVREDWGRDFLVSHGIEAEWMPDPVFLLNKEDYLHLAEQAQDKSEFGYGLAYFVSPNLGIIKRTIIMSGYQNIGKKIFVSDGHCQVNERARVNIPSFLPRIDVQQLLWYIANADFVFTDSFHGACLCLIFNKPFAFCLRTSGGTNIRINSLSRQIGFKIENNGIVIPDWGAVNEKLNGIREMGISWLKNSLGDI